MCVYPDKGSMYAVQLLSILLHVHGDLRTMISLNPKLDFNHVRCSRQSRSYMYFLSSKGESHKSQLHVVQPSGELNATLSSYSNEGLESDFRSTAALKLTSV